LRVVLVVLGVAIASSASAATIHGLVYDDTNRDGKPSVGEPGIANAVVAFETKQFVVTDASGHFDLRVADDAQGIVWVRVPEGFVPGPVWARWSGNGDIDLGVKRLAKPLTGPLTFVVAADTHIPYTEEFFGAADLARVARIATSIDPPPAFFTILGDITQGSRPPEYALVDRALAGLEVPWIPVPGNHDWYDGGAAWFGHYGPDNYSFDLGGVHFLVWNMALAEADIRAYLGAELARVPRTMPIVALTHEPPKPPVVVALRELGVDYVLTGHTHSNRVVDHGDLIELNTEPLLMGGLDFTPAGYRVITIDNARLSSYRRTVVDTPYLAVVSPAADQCVAAPGGALLVAAELEAGASVVTARIDCASPFQLRAVGGWTWRTELPALERGSHTLAVDAVGPSGAKETTTITFEVCATASPPPAAGPDWPQLGGGSHHRGAIDRAITPPLTSRWVTALGGNILTAPPIIASGVVYVVVTDLANGNTGGVVALDLITGAIRWRVNTANPIRGGVAITGDTVVTTQLDGVVLGLDAATGAQRWRRELSKGLPPQASEVFSAPTVDGDSVILGHQLMLTAVTAKTGASRWTVAPIPDAATSQSGAAIAIGGGLAIGSFHRELGGVMAWDLETGRQRWQYMAADSVQINASPTIGTDTIYLVSGATDVVALDFAGHVRWRSKLEPTGFDWGNGSIGTPALARGVLLVPTMYGELVALDAATGTPKWRFAAEPSPIRATHYRGAAQPAFAASPIVTGDVVWIADAAGILSALDVRTGRPRWSTSVGAPVLTGLAASGDWLIVAGYDGTVRALTPGIATPRRPQPPLVCTAKPPAGCCSSGGDTSWIVALALVVFGYYRPRRAR
jgi:outer membrane protein assembly factor BamB/predicted phosphodiesterase